MDWVMIIENAVEYIEMNLTDDLSISRITHEVHISPFYFQKGFSMLCGYSVGEYIRMRRLSLAGNEVFTTDVKIIDLAMKYGYDSPDSFTKAFTRFHGCTPTDVRKHGGNIKSFLPMHIKLMLEGGTMMEYRIEKKKAFQVMGVSKNFSYERAPQEIPQFWNEVYVMADPKQVCGVYGICFDENMDGEQFCYMIADDYVAQKASALKLDVQEIPELTWAIFPCKGAMPQAIQDVNHKIFSQWLPASQYEIAVGFNIEYYSDPGDFRLGLQDPEYYTEVWIPVKEKETK